MKYFNKFYEIGNNRYSTLDADGETFIATESVIKLKKRLFHKQEELVQGVKLLKFTPEIVMLFKKVQEAKENPKQKDVPDEFKTYKEIDNKKLKKDIEKSYKQVYNDAYDSLNEWKDNQIKQHGVDNNCAALEYIEKQYNFYLDLLNKKGIIPENISFEDSDSLKLDNVKHLYNEKVSSFSRNEFYYEQDCFNTITIYRVYVVKDVVKSIDTFLYDKKIINTLMETMYKEGR